MTTINTLASLAIKNIGDETAYGKDSKNNQPQSPLIVSTERVSDAPKALGIVAPPNISANDAFLGVANPLQESFTTSESFGIIKLIHAMYLEMKQDAAENRNAEHQLRWTAMEAAAKKMESAAWKDFASAMVSGLVGIGTGVLAMKAGASAAKKDANASAMEARIKDGNAIKGDTTAQVGAIRQSAARLSSNSFVYAQAGQSLGQMAGATPKLLADLDRAEKERHDADAAKAQAHAEIEENFMRNLNEGAKAIQDFIEQVAAARDKVHSKIVA